jgi:hypothetical protein
MGIAKSEACPRQAELEAPKPSANPCAVVNRALLDELEMPVVSS